MAIRVPDQILAEIKDRVSIREVVQDYLSLKKDGANLKGLCPFHNEKTPSFKVHEAKGIYKCFGCGASGNIFGFLMAVEGMSFPEAVERLAARAGVELPKVELSSEDRKKEEDRSRLLHANELAATYYHRRLLEAEAARPAREYLERRQIAAATVARYRLGFSPPGWDNIAAELGKQGVTNEDLAAAGLLIRKEQGGFYDRFRGRLMFPIVDVQGQVRGFGARLIKDDPDQPKYLNSPESPVFKKGESFYGVHQAIESIRKRRRVLVVEGYIDQIALSQAGVGYALATLGTALTQEHARALRRHGQDVFLVFDTDEAGRKAALRSLEPFLEAGLSPRIVVVPEGKDPDDYMRAHSAEDFERIVEASPPLLAYFMDRLLEAAGNTPAELSRAVTEAAAMTARVQDPIEQGKFLERLARQSGVPLSQLRPKLRRPERRDRVEAGSPRLAAADALAYPRAELEAARLIIHHPETAPLLAATGVLAKFRLAELADFLRKLVAQFEAEQKIDPSARLQEISDPGLVDWISRAIFENDPYGDKATGLVEDVARGVTRSAIETELRQLRREIETAQSVGDEGKWRSLLQAQKDLLSEQRKVSLPLGGR